MKVLNLSLDQKILDKESAVSKRAILYGQKLDKYFVVAIGDNKELQLSDKIKVCGVSGQNKIFSFFKLRNYLRKLLAQEQFDLITIQDAYFLAFLGLCLAKKYHLKSEIQVHGFEKLSGIRKFLAKKNLSRADLLRVVSQRLKNQLVKDFGVSAEKVYIAPVAVDKLKIENSQANLQLKQKYYGKFIFLTVGRLVPVKKIALQIQALAQLDNKKVQLLIVGQGPEKKHLQDLVQEHSLQAQVDFFDWSDDIGSFYKIADCFLLTSQSEGYGMVIAEAVSVNLPVITTDVGVAGDLVEDGTNGFIVPINDLETLKRKMELIVSNSDLLSKFRNNTSKFKDKILDQEELRSKIISNWKNLL
ncbi:glycosyltransferase family 4 protein [Candidatus Nomurabacteria bacterium]|nr:glycosyltransferase family 4 protein [Candidatus Nomurabacteria bacterium]